MRASNGCASPARLFLKVRLLALCLLGEKREFKKVENVCAGFIRRRGVRLRDESASTFPFTFTCTAACTWTKLNQPAIRGGGSGSNDSVYGERRRKS